jgi:hypothetical protein
VSAALYNMFVQVQSIVSSNIYRQDDIPDYSRLAFRKLLVIGRLADTLCPQRKETVLWSPSLCSILCCILL